MAESNTTNLTLNNLNAEEKEFKNALDKVGVPTTEDALKTEFDSIVKKIGIEITNTSSYSPFWQLITAIAIKPFSWLTAFLVREAMPNCYVKTAKGAFLDFLGFGYDLKRKKATTAVGYLNFYRDSVGQELEIPANTIVRTIAINNKIYRMKTTQNVSFPINETSVKVLATAVEAGSSYNLATGYYSILENNIPGITKVTNESDYLTVIGADREADSDFRQRLRNQFTAVSNWHTDAKYKAIISKVAGISSTNIFFDHNIPRGPGSADAYILFNATAPSEQFIKQLNTYINTEGNHGHGDDLQVKVLPATLHDIEVIINFSNDVGVEEKTDLKQKITDFIKCAFRENSDYKGNVTQTTAFDVFSFSRLDQELHNYFTGIKNFKWNKSEITSNMNVPRLKSLTVKIKGE